jgi:hypothetical protein
MDSLKKFRANDSITRQEAAKMFVSLKKNLFHNSLNTNYACEDAYHDGASFDPTLQSFIREACTL